MCWEVMAGQCSRRGHDTYLTLYVMYALFILAVENYRFIKIFKAFKY